MNSQRLSESICNLSGTLQLVSQLIGAMLKDAHRDQQELQELFDYQLEVCCMLRSVLSRCDGVNAWALDQYDNLIYDIRLEQLLLSYNIGHPVFR